MSSYSFILATLSSSGIAAAGIGGVNLSRWKKFEDANPTVDSSLTENGFVWDPVVKPNKWSGIDFKNLGCFERMFPRVSVNHKYEDRIVTSSNPTPKEYPTQKAIACATMDLQSIPESIFSKESFYYFTTELVVKGESSAVALWVGATDLDKGDNGGWKKRVKDSLVYRVVSLGKEGSVWNVVDGYQWSNYSGGYVSDTGSMGGLYIKSPDSDGYWLSNKKSGDFSAVTPEYWAGIWEVVEEGDENGSVYSLLSDIKVFRSLEKYAEILGMDGVERDKFMVEDRSKLGYSQADVLYYGRDQGFIKMEKADISGWLDKLYEPFLKQRGKWTELYARCDSLSYDRNLRDENVDRIRPLCYSEGR